MTSVKFTHAVVCRFPESLKKEAPINYEIVKNQHEYFVKCLRDIGIDVLELPADENLPYCGYVEDTAVICNGVALITRPEKLCRAREAEIMKVVLKKELDLPVIDINDQSATLDGGDVLFTGKEFFVGIGKSTNEAGARAVAAAFPEFPCTPIKIPDNCHLKSLLTMAGPDIICVGSGKNAQDVLNRIKREATFSYQTFTVPEDQAANVLYINGLLFHRSESEIPLSYKMFSEKLDCCRQPLDISELTKGGSGISSCCLLIRRNRRYTGVF